MGIPQILSEVLDVAGRKVNLREYADGILPLDDNSVGGGGQRQRRRRRPLRIGLDVSTLIHRACMGFGDTLCDERHLSNFGRAELLKQQEQQQQQEQEVSAEAAGTNSTSSTTTMSEAQKAENALKYRTACANFVTGRIQTLQRESNADILAVFDGASPPIKLDEVRARSEKRKGAERARDAPVDTISAAGNGDSDNGVEQAQEQRVKANRRAGAGRHFADVLSEIMTSFRENKIPFLVSPYESDGQLAYLAHNGYIDLIVTEDSDMIAYYGGYNNVPIMYKLLSDSLKDGMAVGTLLRYDDLITVEAGSKCPNLDLTDYTPAMLAVLFVCAGGDYCRSLKGIGLVSACQIVRSAFFDKHYNSKNNKSPLEVVFKLLFEKTYEKHYLSEQYKDKYRENFLSALVMYRHPVVYDPIQHACIRIGDNDDSTCQPDPELSAYTPYTKLVEDVDKCERDITGHIIMPPELAQYIAEGWISPRYKKPYDNNTNNHIPDHVRMFLEGRNRTNEVPMQVGGCDDDDREDKEEPPPPSAAGDDGSKRDGEEMEVEPPCKKQKNGEHGTGTADVIMVDDNEEEDGTDDDDDALLETQVVVNI